MEKINLIQIQETFARLQKKAEICRILGKADTVCTESTINGDNDFNFGVTVDRFAVRPLSWEAVSKSYAPDEFAPNLQAAADMEKALDERIAAAKAHIEYQASIIATL